MNINTFISIYLDTRRAKANGKFPVKLRVFTASPRKQKLYPTKFQFTQAEFESIWETTKPRLEYKDIKRELQALENRAIEVAEEITPFTFEAFERKIGRQKSDETNLVHLYQDIIKQLHEEKRFSTEESYFSTIRSLVAFSLHKKGKIKLLKDFPKRKEFRENGYQYSLDLHEINAKWLEQYERFMTDIQMTSLTTIGIYLRTLRTIINNAIENNSLNKELYPFGKKRYQIPAPSSVKKSFNKDQLVTLFYANPQNEYQEKAKAFWFFSFACNGINIKDIAFLRNENIDGDKIVFYRSKTKRSTKTHLKPITVYLTEKSRTVIEKYGSGNNGPRDFIFPIIAKNQTDEEQFTAIRNFNKFVNQHLKTLAESVGLTTDVSAYWARHSYATQTVRLGKSLEYVGESLGHTSPKTTKSYFAGFEDEEKKEFMKAMMDF